MTFSNLLITAINALTKNKLRSALTSIGVIIGVSSVIIMIGIGSSAQIAIKDKVSKYGANAVSVKSYIKPFTSNDMENIKNIFNNVQYISPINGTWGRLIKYKNKNMVTKIYGVNNDYFKLRNWKIQHGRKFTNQEIIYKEKVAIVGNKAKEKLIGENPIQYGDSIYIENIPFKVIGVLSEVGLSLSSHNFDEMIFIPYTTAGVKLIGSNDIYEIYISTDEGKVDIVAANLAKYFKNSHDSFPGKEGLRINTSKEEQKKANDITKILSILLASIASISLIVGGIGIMNIMLVSVSERTREIGIRMAIGAKGSDILSQFLIESIMLSAIGGTVGITLGLTIYFFITYFVKWPFIFSIFSIFISFLVASLTGILAGFYPAKKASNLNPIDALRVE